MGGEIIEMTASASIYVQQDAHSHAVDKLEAIVRNFDPAAPDMVRSLIIQVLGEDLNVWSDDCKADKSAMTPRLVA